MYVRKCFLCFGSVYPEGFWMVMSEMLFVIYCFWIWISVLVSDEKIRKVVFSSRSRCEIQKSVYVRFWFLIWWYFMIRNMVRIRGEGSSNVDRVRRTALVRRRRCGSKWGLWRLYWTRRSWNYRYLLMLILCIFFKLI